MRKPSLKPTIRRYNISLSKLISAGVRTYAEAVRDRGDWAKLHKRRPKALSR